jgi:erythronate-4-phosphate dehydrogenase
MLQKYVFLLKLCNLPICKSQFGQEYYLCVSDVYSLNVERKDMKVVIDDKIPFIKGALEPCCEVVYLPGAQTQAKDVKDADALITRTRTACNAQLLGDSKVKMIASATIGFDHIDTEWCAANGITWTNAPGCNSGSVMQYVASVLSLLILDKKWDLKSKKMGVVGVGNVGKKVAALARSFGMQVFEVDPPRQDAEPDAIFYRLEEIVDELDIISFHTPLEYQGPYPSYHLFSEELLKRVKNGVVFINSSRGEVADSKALKTGLKEGRIGLAVLDVWEGEPHIDKDLLDLVWIGTPHIAGYSQDGKANGTTMSIRAVSQSLHLGLDNWQPKNIPLPNDPIIEFGSQSIKDNEMLARAILHTYDVQTDDAALRKQIHNFEKLRGNYPVRREFKAYQVRHAQGDCRRKLQDLGFQVED